MTPGALVRRATRPPNRRRHVHPHCPMDRCAPTGRARSVGPSSAALASTSTLAKDRPSACPARIELQGPCAASTAALWLQGSASRAHPASPRSLIDAQPGAGAVPLGINPVSRPSRRRRRTVQRRPAGAFTNAHGNCAPASITVMNANGARSADRKQKSSVKLYGDRSRALLGAALGQTPNSVAGCSTGAADR